MGENGHVRGSAGASGELVRRHGNRRIHQEEVVVERRRLDRRTARPGLDTLIRVLTESGEELTAAR